MPTPTFTPGDNKQKQDDRLNPSDRDYNRRFNEGNFEERLKDTPSQEDVEKGLGDLENFANGRNDQSKNTDDIRNQENEGTWADKTGQSPVKQAKGKAMQIAVQFAKKRGGLIGLLGALGVGGGLLAGFFGPASMLINLMENFTDTNDTVSTSMERRILKVLGYANNPDPICQDTSKKLTLKCRAGKISNSALKNLEAKGIVAYFDSGVTNDTTKKYPPRNPSGYTIETEPGKTVNVAARDLQGYLANNPKIAVKVLGTGGAFNVKLRAYSGKYFNQKFYQKFSINKNGGVADGTNKRMTAAERAQKINERVKERLGIKGDITGVQGRVGEKIKGHLGKTAKGGVAYTAAVATCIVPKAPGYIAAGVAAIELLPVIAAVNDFSLSPGSKMKVSGVDTANSITSEDLEFVSSTFTDKSLDADSGKMLAAVDSPYLQSAMGVNTNKVAVSKKFVPGMAFLTSDIVIAANRANKAMEPGCNAIMSPAAMYSAMAVDAAATVALSATVVGGVVKVIASAVLSVVISEVAAQVASFVAGQVLNDIADTDKYGNAKGKEFGDVIGIGAMAFFSSSAMSRHLPGLKMSQLNSAAAVKQESEDFTRDMEVASLSPFDTSSKYTFLGSIVNNMNLAMIKNGGYTNNPLSLLSSIISLPSSFSPQSASAAAEFTQSYCGYAKEFGLEVGDANGAVDANQTPAINAAGMPCTGLTQEQAGMSTETAIDLIMNEGWIDETKTIKESDTISDLMTSGYIKADTPLTDFIETCSSPDTGDYLFNAAGCTTEGSAKSTNIQMSGVNGNCTTNGDDETVCGGDEGSGFENANTEGVKDSRSLMAIPVFLLDYQQISSINGEDEPDFSASGATSEGEYVMPVDPGFATPDESQDWGPRNICAGDANSFCKFHRGIDFSSYAGGSEGKPVYSVADGEVIQASLGNPSCISGINSDNRVQIRHANGAISGYSHMTTQSIQAAGIKVGDKVKAGQQIGTIGNCGNSFGAHLHFTISPGSATDPNILSIDSNNNGEVYINPVAYMALFGVDLMTGTYTDGR